MTVTSKGRTPSTHLALNGDGSVCNSVHAEDGRLWRVDDRSSEQTSVDAAIADRERSTRHIFDRNLVFTRL